MLLFFSTNYLLNKLTPWKIAFEISWPLKKHDGNCEQYQKLMENGNCCVCKNHFLTRQELNMCIGHNHNIQFHNQKNIIFIGYFYHNSDLTVFLFHFGSSCIWFRSANTSLLWLWPMCIFNACLVSKDFLQTPHFPLSINFWYSSQLPSWFFKRSGNFNSNFSGL